MLLEDDPKLMANIKERLIERKEHYEREARKAEEMTRLIERGGTDVRLEVFLQSKDMENLLDMRSVTYRTRKPLAEALRLALRKYRKQYDLRGPVAVYVDVEVLIGDRSVLVEEEVYKAAFDTINESARFGQNRRVMEMIRHRKARKKWK